jgi:acyl carrier protein
VIDFVADESGIRRNKITLDSHLSEDLGIDGLDAEELFRAFSEKFGVDLTPLWDHWDDHFATEGGPNWLVFIPVAICFLIGWAIHHVLDRYPFWVYGLALLALWIRPLRCWPFKGTALSDIAVQELVESAKQGKWIRTYEAVNR